MSKLKRNDLQAIARARLQEARLLLDGGAFAGAYYLTGLAIECALKACIARATEAFEFPDFRRAQDSWNHDLSKLLNAAGLTDEMKQRSTTDAAFEANWLAVKDWKVESRYEQRPEAQARSIYNATTDLTHGILPWIEGYW